MNENTTERVPPTQAASGIADTEGHSMLTPELARATQSERTRQAENASRERARVREARPGRDRGFLDPLRGR
jgi:hypothetical protein